MAQHRHPQFYGRKIVVAGLGISGLWTARYLAAHGADVTVSEKRPEMDLDPGMCREIRALGVVLEAGGHTMKTFMEADMIIVSPGVPTDIPILHAAREKGIQVIGELELAGRLVQAPVIAITGTNGKSTVTAALSRMLELAGLNVFVGGNIGTPLMALAAGGEKPDYAVVEVSSFQLDTTVTFCPRISVILNITPDHLDRYRGYDDYVRSKLKIFSNQKSGHHLVLNDDDQRLAGINPSSGVSVLRYGTAQKPGRHAYVKNGEILARTDDRDDRQPDRFPVASYKLPGKHNRQNLMAVILACRLIGIDPAVIRRHIGNLRGLPHRLEYVGEVEGVTYYDDSKATNVDAAVRAVESFDRPLILIAGGRHKGADYSPLVRACKKQVRKAVFLGEAKDLLCAAFDGCIAFSTARDMAEAVALARQSAQRGDTVLLSPACASFDMFSDYRDRGRVFKSIVVGLSRG